MSNTRNGLTFEQWLARVDAVLVGRTGLESSDMADFNSYDAWSDEMTPSEGAEECLMGDDTYSEAFADGEI